MEKSAAVAVEENLKKGQPSSFKNFKDVTFSILFAVNTVIIFALAMSYGIGALNTPGPDHKDISGDGAEKSSSSSGDGTTWILGILFITGMASAISIGCVFAISFLSAQSVTCTMYSILTVSGAVALFLLIMGNMVGGLLSIAILVSSIVFYFYVKDRVAFAAINIKIASCAITSMPWIMIYAYVSMAIAILWVLLWSVAVIGVATNESSDTISKDGEVYLLSECSSYSYSDTVTLAGVQLTCGSSSCNACVCDETLVKTSSCFNSTFYVGKYIAMLLSVAWAISVFTNIVHCTTAGAVATWWFDAISTPRSEVVYKSFLRAVTTSFGAICLGSLMVAIISTTRSIVRYLRSTASISARNGIGSSRRAGYILSCLDVVLRVLYKAIQYFNRYAYSYVAIYGYGFIEASSAVVRLFRARGFSAVMNDGLIDSVMRFGQAVVAILCLMISHIYVSLTGLDYASRTTLSAIALMEGYFLSAIVFKVFSAAVTTIYVCYAEDPQAFQSSHPELYVQLHNAWVRIYPANLVEIDDEADDDAFGPPGGGTSCYVPPTLPGSGSAGPSWYYKSVPTASADVVNEEEDFQGWATTSSSGKNKTKTVNDYTNERDAMRAVEDQLASAAMNAAVSNPDTTSALIAEAEAAVRNKRGFVASIFGLGRSRDLPLPDKSESV